MSSWQSRDLVRKDKTLVSLSFLYDGNPRQLLVRGYLHIEHPQPPMNTRIIEGSIECGSNEATKFAQDFLS